MYNYCVINISRIGIRIVYAVQKLWLVLLLVFTR